VLTNPAAAGPLIPTPCSAGHIYGALVVGLFQPAILPIEFGAIWRCTWLVLVGFVDDRHGMKPWIKMSAQVVAGLVLVAAGIHVRIFSSDLLDIALTLFWIVGITNAMNFQDNMDGLAAGLTAVASVFFFVMAAEQDLSLVSSLARHGGRFGGLIRKFQPGDHFHGRHGEHGAGILAGGAGDQA
jgi:UDP-GlcNAc:undecaprenyl-phosphate GlcNAc-1-phosphate transferase